MSKSKHFNPMADHVDRHGGRSVKVHDISYEDISDESDLAWELVMPDGTKHWFPKSQCELYENDKVIGVPAWLCRDKGIEV